MSVKPPRRRESDQPSTSYFSAFSPISRKAISVPAIDTSSPLSRFSSLPPLSGTPQSQHPLVLELHSLRASLGKFQHVAHKTSMQLQGKAMEVVMAQDEVGRLRVENKVLKEEVEVLRKSDYAQDDHHLSPTTPLQHYPNNALSELTLAHRRLSSKLDITEDALHHANSTASQLELENERLQFEMEEKDVLAATWRVKVEEMAEEVEKERLERRKVEEELKICQLALAEYQKAEPVVDNSSPGAEEKHVDENSKSDPAETPSVNAETTTLTNNAQTSMICPSCTASFIPPQNAPTDPALPAQNTITTTTHLASTPTNILLAIRATRYLFNAFQDQLLVKSREIVRLEHEVEEMSVCARADKEMVEVALREKEVMRTELDKVKADDESASKVVERYMAFSQKTTQHLHSNFQSQTTRLSQTISTLRHQLLSTQTLLDREVARTAQLRSAIDELAEGFERETFGRRREVGLRLKSLEREEKRHEEGRRWAERVRRERSRLGGMADAGGTLTVHGKSVGMSRSPSPFVSPSKGRNSNLLHPSPSSTSLASMNNNAALNPYEENQHLSTLWDLLESGIELFAGHEDESLSSVLQGNRGDDGEVDNAAARVILAQEMTMSLMEELERTNRKLVALERKRLEWIATGTAEGAGDAPGYGTEPTRDSPVDRSYTLVPTIAANGAAKENVSPAPDLAGPDIPATQGLQLDLTGLDKPRENVANINLQNDATNLLLQRLQNANGRFSVIQKQLSDCAASVSNLQSSSADISPAYASTLQILLDGISDVVEDVRVEVEIAITDDHRDLKGYQTVLKLDPDNKTIAKANEYADPEYVAGKSASFAKRLSHVEHDLVAIKVALSEMQTEEPKPNGPGGMDEEIVNPLLGLTLRTVRAPAPLSRASMQHRQLGNRMKRGFFGGLGRTLSGTTPTTTLSRASSVSRPSPFASLNGTQMSPSEDEASTPVALYSAVERNVDEIDDVE
ncbi:hypothetical protein QFC21_002495 [Naganishia friedmannii]|uniref:Uncharacterized protein n=1 Tax=Naganishia friedmannii TaxID=89922 RepID=A0ACC2VUI7_9TREE|nr:hypothetical protein QFC21_002495 [Naganishia friedmannii]